MDTQATQFPHSVRGNYTGKRHVSAWFRYHKSNHNWQLGVDYTVVGTEKGNGDWLLTDAAAKQCLLDVRHDLASDDSVIVGDEFVYVATIKDGSVKIGFTRYIQSRMQKLKPVSYLAVQCHDAFQVEQALHRLYAPQRINGEFYRGDAVNPIEVAAVAAVLSKHRQPTTTISE